MRRRVRVPVQVKVSRGVTKHVCEVVQLCGGAELACEREPGRGVEIFHAADAGVVSVLHVPQTSGFRSGRLGRVIEVGLGRSESGGSDVYAGEKKRELPGERRTVFRFWSRYLRLNVGARSSVSFNPERPVHAASRRERQIIARCLSAPA